MSKQWYKNFLSTGFGQENMKNYQHIIKMYKHNYQEFLPENKEAKILDIGCGMGQFLSFAGQLGYENIFGVDISAQAISFCHEQGIYKTQEINDLLEFLKTSESQDLIVLNDVIEHLSKNEALRVVTLAKEKLNANGSLIIKTGNLSSMVGPRIRYMDFTHKMGFTENSLEQFLRLSGFDKIQIKPFVFPKNSVTRILRFIGQKIIHACWKLIFFLEYTQAPKIVDELIFAVARK